MRSNGLLIILTVATPGIVSDDTPSSETQDHLTEKSRPVKTRIPVLGGEIEPSIGQRKGFLA